MRTAPGIQGAHADAIVVGAGPAGASAALHLARRGADVIVLERARMPRTKVCGEYLSPTTLQSLSDMRVLDEVRARAHPLARLSLAGFGIGPVTMRLPALGALSIARSEFDMLLARAAYGAGARALCGTFVNATETSGGVEVIYRDEAGDMHSVRSRALVGADGSWSAVAQRAGMVQAKRSGGRWAVGGHLPASTDSDVLEMYVGAQGYYARNPLGGGLTNVMLVMPRAILDDEADATARRVSDGRCGLAQNELVRRVVVGPLRYRARVPSRGRIVLTGDAAELLDPFLGQGIALALGLSPAAADAAAALAAGGEPRAIAHRYAAMRERAVRRVRFVARAVDALLRVRWLRGRAARKIARRPELGDQLLDAIAGEAPDGRRLALAWDLIA